MIDVPVVSPDALTVTLELSPPPLDDERLPVETIRASWNGRHLETFDLTQPIQTLRLEVSAEIQRRGLNTLALHPVLSKNPIDAVRRADSTLDARRVATFVTAESLC